MIKSPLVDGERLPTTGQLLWNGPPDSAVTVVLAHGAGQPMDSPFLSFFADGLARAGYRVARFEFPYMAAMRSAGVRRPPDRKDILLARWRTVIASLAGRPLIIGGKSLGGRIASEIADEAGACGLLCLGYPFHPPDKPENLRVDHLARLRTPTLILQGTRDPFGVPEEVACYPLSATVRIHWLADGDHGFVPRVRSGRSEEANFGDALAAMLTFIAGVKTSAEKMGTGRITVAQGDGVS